MKKLILIDGNSLLNRAFYAMSVFTTKNGTPTNGIFGFVKLVLKILEDEKPNYFAVAFDVHAPTFRHNLYENYKGTRKPMPEELVVQVPILKDLLQSMDICMVEKAGYEADDIIGTLSRKFPEVQTFIYTGDRDAYQLVNENVSVCFTKRGVSDIDLMTSENFYAKEGITPAQVIELKSLMGDNSDNIPGVAGIGPVKARELLSRYGTLDECYKHLDELQPAVRQKLIASESNARLSHTLATIDTNVPLELSLENCTVSLPFSESVREAFSRLEFRSLMDSVFFAPKHRSGAEIVFHPPLDEFKAQLKNSEEFAVCETDGIHVCFGGKEYVFHRRKDFLSPGLFENELDELVKLLFTSGKRVIVNDVKQILHRLSQVGITYDCSFEDLSLLRYLVNSGMRPVSEKELIKDYLLSEDNCAYALYLAYGEAVGEISETELKLYREIELPLAFVLYQMECTGVRVDESRFSEFSKRYNDRMRELSQKIFESAGQEFNLNSPFQLSEILFDKLGFQRYGAKKNIRGGYSTNAEILEKLAEEHEIARLILSYREYQKLQSTYVDGIRPLVKDGIVHTTYNQTMTTTGRLSSANPNLQNIPVRRDEGKELRKLFIARDGNILVDADYSQIELRLLAHFSGCKPLIEAYNEGKDIHATTAAQVFGVSLGDVTETMRRRAKVVNFGIIYGMSSYGLAKDLACSPSEAQEIIDRYFKTYADVKEYMRLNVENAKKDGYVKTILGRKRWIPEIKSSNYNVRSFGERAAMNMPLQGSSADIIKIAMNRVSERLSAEKMQAKLVLQVHDELALDTPLAEKDAVSALLKEEMEGAIQLNVPLIAEVKTGKSWYEAK